MEIVGSAWIHSKEKRRGDIITSFGLLAITFPALFLSSTLIFAEDYKRPFFSQNRVGQNGKLFSLYKLRTMSRIDYNNVSEGPYDERATRIGRFLRISTLDEAPQLLNIMSGKMSIVGPRPLLSVDYERMKNNLPTGIYTKWLEAVKESKPGLVSSFGIHSRTVGFRPGNSLFLRADLDIEDYEFASREHDRELKKKAIKVGKNIARNLILGNK